MTSGANRGTCDPTLTGLLGGVSRCDETAGGRGRSVSVLVEVSSEDENGPTYEAYYAPNRWGAYTSTTLTAVGYR